MSIEKIYLFLKASLEYGYLSLREYQSISGTMICGSVKAYLKVIEINQYNDRIIILKISVQDK